MDFREYITNKIKKNKRIIEFGPLNRAIIKKDEFKNIYYSDIKSKKEIIDLYTGNEYLKNTGIEVDTGTIVDIDYVIKKDYKNTFKNIEKFDYAILSHVIEHMPDILFFFKDLENVLKDKGKVIIIYPDIRYCFDHFRNEASLRDAYATYTDGTSQNARLSFDFMLNVIKENNAYYLWNDLNISSRINTNNQREAIETYENTKKGIFLDDVHYWSFSDYGFIKFLYEGKKLGLINYDLVEIYKTQPNTQEFMVILEYNKEQNKSNFEYIKTVLDDLDPVIKESKLRNEINNKNEEISKLSLGIIDKDNEIKDKNKNIEEISNELSNIYNSKSWRYTNLLRNLSGIIRKK